MKNFPFLACNLCLFSLVLLADVASSYYLSFAPFHHRYLKRYTNSANANADNAGDNSLAYEKFNPDQFEKGTPEWNLAMINYLLDMKKQADINNVTEDLENAETIRDGNIVCKMEPLNLCYSLDQDGNMSPIGEHRPVRLLRIYK